MKKQASRAFVALDSDGAAHTWRYWRDDRRWYMKSPDGYTRGLEASLMLSLPRMRVIVENYGMSAVELFGKE